LGKKNQAAGHLFLDTAIGWGHGGRLMEEAKDEMTNGAENKLYLRQIEKGY